MRNLNKNNRRSVRLKHCDYSEPGDYFITICSKDMECIFGNIQNHIMFTNKIGEIVKKYWLEIPKHFPGVLLDKFVVMPNHIHGIITIIDVCRGAINRVPTGEMNGGFAGSKNPMLNPGSLSKIIRWFKGRTTFEIHKKGFDFQWQRNYHEHIIRNEKSLNNIRDYIINNPVMWDLDRNNLGNMDNNS